MKLYTLFKVKDEIDLIKDALDQYLLFSNKIVLMDNGSTDGTLEIIHEYMKRYRGRFIFFEETKYAEGRNCNKMLDLARDDGADWVLKIDTDEFFEDFLFDNDCAVLKGYLRSDLDAVAFRIYHFDYRAELIGFNPWKDYYRIDGGALSMATKPQIRLVRVIPGMTFPIGDIHSSHIIGYGPNFGFSRVRIKHYSLRSKEQAFQKYKLYCSIFEQGEVKHAALAVTDPEDPYIKGMRYTKWHEDESNDPVAIYNTVDLPYTFIERE